eukprot:TRINITY_DN5255_c0_g3_i1.p1 TRINITY_DN5255_c0_g3~~TRINITY_DN5255_c0_g3_i1.p1  ORF type:complete len:637 (-),score=211.54 TRINITY_DN5255_c0_g3_i1:18-1928(-)
MKTILVVICLLEVLIWTSLCTVSSDVDETGVSYLLRESENFKNNSPFQKENPLFEEEVTISSDEFICETETENCSNKIINSTTKVDLHENKTGFGKNQEIIEGVEIIDGDDEKEANNKNNTSIISMVYNHWKKSLLILGVTCVIAFYLTAKLYFYLTTKKFGSVKCTLKEKDADVIIIGAGVIGSALATALGKQGKKVLIIERSLKEPNRIVGELLQPGGVEQIKKLGLSECFENIDSPVTNGYAVFNKEDVVILDYPEINCWDEENNKPESKKSVPHGRSFHHGRFVQNLRKAIYEIENVTAKEGSVISLIEEKTENGLDSVIGVNYKQDGIKKQAYAPLVIGCDGIQSKFRKVTYKKNLKANSSFVGLVLKDVELPYPDRGHVILVDPAPILAYPISSNHVRILIDIPHPLPKNSNGDLKRYLQEKVCPQLPESIQQPFLDALEEQQIRSMNCSRLHPEINKKLGFLLVGDSHNVRHPLTGGGMTVGFADVVIFRDILAQFDDLSDQGMIQDSFDAFYAKRGIHSVSINVLAQALYEVFSNYDPNMVYMREACFAYFNLGKTFYSGPMGLLAGVITNPLVLVTHFFTVAFYSILLNLIPIPYPSNIKKTFLIFTSACKLILPLLYYEHFLRLFI